MTEQGGTVRYHRAEWTNDPDHPWRVQFTEGSIPHGFTAAEGEAMGLTPPEPAPLVVTCNGHSIELSDEIVQAYTDDWNGVIDDSPHGRCARALARLLRDARQDPQPASDPEPAPADSDDLDFDAMPVGIVLSDYDDDLWVRLPDGWQSKVWSPRLPESYAPYDIVYQPAPLSPGECLRGLLAWVDQPTAREAHG